MLVKLPTLGDAVSKLLPKCLDEHRDSDLEWLEDMHSGSTCYTKPCSFNYMRICLNADINHIQKQRLKPDNSNLVEATSLAIQACGRDQYSTRLAIKNAAISKAKSLFHRGMLSEDVLFKLRKIKIVRTKDPKRQIIYYKDLQRILQIIYKDAKRSLSSRSLDEIIVLFLFWSGVRVSEFVNLNLDDIDLERDRFFVRWSKNGKSRWVGIHRDLRPHLEKYLQSVRAKSVNPKAFLLPDGRALTVDRVIKRVKSVTKKAGVDAACHAFRAGMATYFHNERNVPLESLQKILGHANIQTTMIYVRSSIEDTLQKQVNW